MKKKILSLLLVAIMACSLCACGGSETSNGNNADTKVEENEKRIIITKEELETYSEYIELTTENWSEYIEIVEEEVIEKDAFGEETGRYTKTCLTLKDNCYISEDNALRLTYMRDYGSFVREETEDFVFYGRKIGISVDMEYEIICEKVKGTILKLTVPAEKWSTDEEGQKVLYIQESEYTYRTLDDDIACFD